MSRARIVLPVAAAAILVAGLVWWKSCRAPATVPRSERARPEPKDEDPIPGKRPSLKKGRSDTDRTKLLEWIRRLGRAVVVRDRRTERELRAAPPTVYDSDVAWILSLLGEELFTSAGAAHLLSWFDLPDSVPALAAMLRGPAHPAAKDVAVASLAAIGGDAACAALLDALAKNPDASIRARAARALAQFRGPEVYRGLVDALRDPDVDVRRYAAEALYSLPSKEMIEVLLARLPAEPDVRVAADLALAAFAAGKSEVLDRIFAALRQRPDVESALRDRLKLEGKERYAQPFDAAFFRDGGTPVPRGPGYRRIGIVIEPGNLPSARAAAPLFTRSPLDRYREFFYYRVESEFTEDLSVGAVSPRAYDVDGSAVPGGIPVSDLDGVVHLRFRDPAEFGPGVLGFTEGREAHVTSVSLFHEFGHAFARLADEYDLPQASNAGEVNVDLPDREPKWQGLIVRGLLGPPRPRGDRVIPSDACHMNNRPADDRWCPVCQLEILARICERTGAAVPW